jgi:predicted phosphohydrolase
MEPELLVTSDLHYGASPEGDRAVEALAEHVRGDGAAALVLAGDLAMSTSRLETCLSLFDGFRGFKAAVPGNHDIWRSMGSTDSWDLHERVLPATFERHGFHPLHVGPAVLDGVAIVGSMGWYDYSFRDDIGIDIAAYRSKVYPGEDGPLWNDAICVRLPTSDEELTALLARRLSEQLANVPPELSVLAVVHHLVTRQLLIHPRAAVPRRWRFANAFLGSDAFGRVLAGRVAQVFCGHAHYARVVMVNGARCVVVGSDYTKKQLLRATPTRLLESRMFE